MSEPFLRDQLRALGAMLAILEAPGFVFGGWDGGQRLPNGTIQMPYYTLSPEAERFRTAAAALLRRDFDWPAWSQTAEFQGFDREPATIAAATAEQLGQLLTVYVRGERFGDGTLEAAYERGVLTAIARRAAVLAADGRGSPVP
jgi:hypothetical protein